MRFFLLLTVLTVVLMAAPAKGNNNLPAGSVGDMLDNCESLSAISPTHATLPMGLCLGFTNAVLQGLRLRAGDNAGICLPATFTGLDTVNVFVSWGKGRSQSLQDATLGILDALREKFPCKR
jgi:hypothetical protein